MPNVRSKIGWRGPMCGRRSPAWGVPVSRRRVRSWLGGSGGSSRLAAYDSMRIAAPATIGEADDVPANSPV